MRRVLGFCEGARQDSGGVGLIGVPLIHKALANRGYIDALAVGGQPMPSALSMLAPRIEDILNTSTGAAVGIVPFPAIGRWCFSPALYRAAAASAMRVDFITLHSVFSFPVLAGYQLARRFNKPFGLWPHGVFAPVQREIGKQKKSLYSALFARRILERASVLFYSAEGEREEARALGVKTPSVIIPHGIDSEPFEHLPTRGTFRSRYLDGHSGPLVLYLGRLNAKKGIDLLVEAMADVLRRVPTARLAIVGGGDPPAFLGQLQRWVAKAGIEHATVITGRLDEQDKLTAFADSDVFVLPSAAENFGFAMFEALASQRAVVIGETLNYSGEVARCEAGLVVPRTSADFADAIVRLIHDATLRERLGRNGLELTREYSWDACGRRIESAVLSVINRHPFAADLKPE